MKGENGSSALMVRPPPCFSSSTASNSHTVHTSCSISAFFLAPRHLLLLGYSCTLLMHFLFSSHRRHCYHLCGGQQQLQHGNKGRQQHQPATGSPGSLPQYLEQQVSQSLSEVFHFFFPLLLFFLLTLTFGI